MNKKSKKAANNKKNELLELIKRFSISFLSRTAYELIINYLF